MYKAKDLRDQSLDELELLYDESCKALFQLKNQAKASKRSEAPHKKQQVRKDIARLLTVIAEKRCQQLHSN